jgi:hypothetical protein
MLVGDVVMTLHESTERFMSVSHCKTPNRELELTHDVIFVMVALQGPVGSLLGDTGWDSGSSRYKKRKDRRWIPKNPESTLRFHVCHSFYMSQQSILTIPSVSSSLSWNIRSPLIVDERVDDVES